MRATIDSLYAFSSDALELAIHFLDRTWAGSIVEAVVGKVAVIAALQALLRYVRALQVKAAAQRQARAD